MQTNMVIKIHEQCRWREYFLNSKLNRPNMYTHFFTLLLLLGWTTSSRSSEYSLKFVAGNLECGSGIIRLSSQLRQWIWQTFRLGVTAGRNWGSNYYFFCHKPLACEYFHSGMDGCLYSCVEFNGVETWIMTAALSVCYLYLPLYMYYCRKACLSFLRK
jgi:hypothetical protein